MIKTNFFIQGDYYEQRHFGRRVNRPQLSHRLAAAGDDKALAAEYLFKQLGEMRLGVKGADAKCFHIN